MIKLFTQDGELVRAHVKPQLISRGIFISEGHNSAHLYVPSWIDTVDSLKHDEQRISKCDIWKLFQ